MLSNIPPACSSTLCCDSSSPVATALSDDGAGEALLQRPQGPSGGFWYTKRVDVFGLGMNAIFVMIKIEVDISTSPNVRCPQQISRRVQ
eukprot:6194384-Pleurochrysis_carterae.AAC.4